MAEAVKIRVEPRDPAKNKGTGTGWSRGSARQGGSRPSSTGTSRPPCRSRWPATRLADDQGVEPPGRAGPGRHDRDGARPRRPVGPPRQGDPPPRFRPRQRRGVDRDRGPLEIRGTPPGVAEGGILEMLVHKLRVTCPASAIPDSIRVDVSHLGSTRDPRRDLALPRGRHGRRRPRPAPRPRRRARRPGRDGRSRGRRGGRPSPKSSSPSARKKRRQSDGRPRPGRLEPRSPLGAAGTVSREPRPWRR